MTPQQSLQLTLAALVVVSSSSSGKNCEGKRYLHGDLATMPLDLMSPPKLYMCSDLATRVQGILVSTMALLFGSSIRNTNVACSQQLALCQLAVQDSSQVWIWHDYKLGLPNTEEKTQTGHNQ